MQDFEKQLICDALAETGNNKAQTAQYLNIDISSLYRKMRKYGIPVD